MVTWPPKCIKYPDSQCITPDTAAMRIKSPIEGPRITIEYQDGTQPPLRLTYPANQISAIFFDMSSVDKMLIPYYTQLYGVTEAARMREAIRR